MFYWYFWALANYVPLLCICCLCSSWQILFRLSALYPAMRFVIVQGVFGVKLRKFYYAFDFAEKNCLNFSHFSVTREQLLAIMLILWIMHSRRAKDRWMPTMKDLCACRIQVTRCPFQIELIVLIESASYFIFVWFFFIFLLNWISIMWPSNSRELGLYQFHQYHNILYQLIHNCRSISCWDLCCYCWDKYIYVNNTNREPEYEIAHMFSGVL